MGHGIDPRLAAVAAVLLSRAAGIRRHMAVDCDRSESSARTAFPQIVIANAAEWQNTYTDSAYKQCPIGSLAGAWSAVIHINQMDVGISVMVAGE
jgi:hypothetical protein